MFAENDEKRIREFVKTYPFAQLSSFDGHNPVVSHLPLLWDESGESYGHLTGHFARANSQWEHACGTRVLAVFSGPHAYISSSWYETPQSVPTWNYTAVHMTGQLRIVEDPQELLEIVRDLVEFMEQDQQGRWSMDQPSEDFVDQLLKMVVGFTIEVDHIEAKFKLSQNHSEQRRQRVITHLEKRPDDDSQHIAELMKLQLRNQ